MCLLCSDIELQGCSVRLCSASCMIALESVIMALPSVLLINDASMQDEQSILNSTWVLSHA